MMAMKKRTAVYLAVAITVVGRAGE